MSKFSVPQVPYQEYILIYYFHTQRKSAITLNCHIQSGSWADTLESKAAV